MNSSRIKMICDIVIAIALLVLMEPKATGLSFHEWAGLAICLGFLIHNLLNWKWISCVTGNFLKHLPAKTRLNYLLDWLLFLGMFVIVLSGIGIAKTIDFSWLPLPDARWLWRGLHASGALLTFTVVGIHIGLHWKWVLCHFRKTQEVL